MNTFLDRLKIELSELDEKLIKLSSFLDSDKINSLSDIQFNLLNMQKNTMATYSYILNMRISDLEKHRD